LLPPSSFFLPAAFVRRVLANQQCSLAQRQALARILARFDASAGINRRRQLECSECQYVVAIYLIRLAGFAVFFEDDLSLYLSPAGHIVMI
jgi:hypothetical protein